MIDTFFSQHTNQISMMPLADAPITIWVQSFEHPAVTLRCRTEHGFVTQIEVRAHEDGTLLLQNKFDTDLLAVSDDVKVEQFDDMIQKMIYCSRNSFLCLSLVKDRVYQISSVH